MSRQRKSWVWQYAERRGEKGYCNICSEDENNEFTCSGGSTGSLGRHLINAHGITSNTVAENITAIDDTNECNSDNYEQRNVESPQPQRNTTNTSISQRIRKRSRLSHSIKKRNERSCSPKRTESIHQALAKMIAINQMPFSFCSSEGFKQFMSVVEPNYKALKEESLKRRLHSLKEMAKTKIKNDLQSVTAVACTSDCWSSVAQESYITLSAHIIDSLWKPKTFTLTTHEMEERHTASNLAVHMEITFQDWGIENKVFGVVTDNAANIVNAIQLLQNPTECSHITCAAHTIQIAVNKALEIDDSIKTAITKAKKVVGHFKHSNVAKHALETKQEQLGINKQTLLQCCNTRWNSVYFMLERMIKNRNAIANVLSDRSVTTIATALILEITECEWSTMETIMILLKPLQVATTVFCSDNESPTSMVRPILQKTLENHFQICEDDDNLSSRFKAKISEELKARFNLGCEFNIERGSSRHFASLLDPRYKDLHHEPAEIRPIIRQHVKDQLAVATPQNINDEEQPTQNSALQFLYQQNVNSNNDPNSQFENYLAEPQLRFDLDPYEWWKTREKKYPAVAALAKKYLSVPASSASSERVFSTAGNIVLSKRSCLLPENVDMLVFLYQNRSLL